MLSYTVYSESGGTEKTTNAANLARAHTDQGLDVLVIDMDHQKGNISHLFDVADDQSNPDADHLPRHLIDRGRGPFEDLITTTDEGVDVIPAHDKLEDLNDDLRKYEEMGESMGDLPDDWAPYQVLFNTLGDAGIPNKYDVLIVDPNARAEISLQNALYATRNVVAPVEFGGKGSLSIDGLRELGQTFAQRAGIEIGVLAVVPNLVANTKVQQHRREDIEAGEYDVPVLIGNREALMKEMWEAHGSAFRVVEEQWDLDDETGEHKPGIRRVPDRERETLVKLRELADHVASQSDLDYKPISDGEVPA